MPIKRYNIDKLRGALESRTIILVPNHRIRDAILEAHASETSETTWATANVYAIDIWIKRLWTSAANQGLSPFSSHRILRRIEEQFIWTSLIEKSLEKIPLLNPDETAIETNRAYQLLRLWLTDEASSSLMNYSGTRDVSEFLNWKTQFESFCHKHCLISLVDCTRIVTERIELFVSQFSKTIVLADFIQPPPLYQDLFKALESRAEIKNISSISNKIITNRLRYEFTDSREEILACAKWARKTVANSPHCHIGIVYNAEPSHRPRLEQLFDSGFNPGSLPHLAETRSIFNSTSSGRRLVDTALVGHALMLLHLNNEQQDSNDFCRLLQSPYIGQFEHEIEARIRLEGYMREKLSAICSVTELIRLMNTKDKGYYCPSLASSILENRTGFRAARKSCNSTDWARLFAHQLRIYGWPGTELTSSDAELLSQWDETLAQFASAYVTMGKMNFRAALSRLRTLLADTSLPAHYDRKRQLSLFTTKEAVGLHFDHVWFLGFDEQTFPATPNTSPFIPYSLQKEAGIPGCDSNVFFENSRKEFELVCASATGSIVASHHLTDGDQQLRPSSVIASIELQELPEAASQAIANFAIDRSSTAELVWISDSESVPLQQDEFPRGGQAILTNQSKCPFRAFATHRLHARPLREFENGLSAMARGSAIHIALEYLFGEIDSLTKLYAIGPEEQRTIVTASALAATDYLAHRHKEIMTPRYRKIEQQRIETLLSRFLEIERQRSDYKVIAREQSVQWQHDQLSVNLKIDRVDQLPDGTVVVIDYKTGALANPTQRLFDDRPAEMQLPVYYTVISEQLEAMISAVTNVHVNIDKTDYSGLAGPDNIHPSLKSLDKAGAEDDDWQQLTRSWVEKTRAFAQEFVEGQCRVSPVTRLTACQYCHLDPLCRVQELEDRLLVVIDSGDNS